MRDADVLSDDHDPLEEDFWGLWSRFCSAAAAAGRLRKLLVRIVRFDNTALLMRGLARLRSLRQLNVQMARLPHEHTVGDLARLSSLTSLTGLWLHMSAASYYETGEPQEPLRLPPELVALSHLEHLTGAVGRRRGLPAPARMRPAWAALWRRACPPHPPRPPLSPAVDTEYYHSLTIAVEIPAWLSALASISSLRFEVGSLPTGDDNAGRLAGLTQLRKLGVLLFEHNGHSLPDGLHGLPHLTALDLRVRSAGAACPAARSLSRLGALRSLRWHPSWWYPLPSGILELRSLRSLELLYVHQRSLHPGPCWAGLTHLSFRFRYDTDYLPPVLALATALEHLELVRLVGLDASDPAMLARLPALRRLGLPLKHCDAEVLHALGQACPHLTLNDLRHSDDDGSSEDEGWEG